MRAGPVWLTAYALLPLIGAPLLAHPAYRRLSRPARAVLSAAAGAVLLSFAMTLFSLTGIRWSLLPSALVAALLCLGLRTCLRGNASSTAGAGAAASGDGRFAAILSTAAVAVALVATYAGAAGSSDLLLFWGPKAQAFASARGIDPGFLGSPGNSHMHPYYPPLVTNLYAFATIAAGRFPWGAAAMTFPLILAALAAALPSLLRGADRPWAPGAVSALIVSALSLLGTEADVAGNADIALLLFETLGLALLLAPRPVEPARLLLAGLLLAGATSSKVEGLPFTLAAVLFFLAAGRTRRGTARALLSLLGPSALALGAWFLFGLVRGGFHGYGEYGSLLHLRWDRLSPVLSSLASAFWSAGFALPYLVPLGVLAAIRGGIRVLPLAIAGTLALFLLVTYLLPVPDPGPWIRWSAARTFAPIAALLPLALAGRAR